MFCKTVSEKVCGLMEIRVAPYFLMMRSFSGVGAVGAAGLDGVLVQFR